MQVICEKKGYGLITISFFWVVRPAGFEPAAYGFEEQESWNSKM
jgi:hypothetical protein